MSLTVLIGIIVGVLTILGVIVAVVKAFKKAIQKLDALSEGVLGKPEVMDYSGNVIVKAVPSLQARVNDLETMLTTSNTEDRLTHLEIWRDEHTKETNEVIRRWIDHIDRHPDGT